MGAHHSQKLHLTPLFLSYVSNEVVEEALDSSVQNEEIDDVITTPVLFKDYKPKNDDLGPIKDLCDFIDMNLYVCPLPFPKDFFKFGYCLDDYGGIIISPNTEKKELVIFNRNYDILDKLRIFNEEETHRPFIKLFLNGTKLEGVVSEDLKNFEVTEINLEDGSLLKSSLISLNCDFIGMNQNGIIHVINTNNERYLGLRFYGKKESIIFKSIKNPLNFTNDDTHIYVVLISKKIIKFNIKQEKIEIEQDIPEDYGAPFQLIIFHEYLISITKEKLNIYSKDSLKPLEIDNDYVQLKSSVNIKSPSSNSAFIFGNYIIFQDHLLESSKKIHSKQWFVFDKSLKIVKTLNFEKLVDFTFWNSLQHLISFYSNGKLFYGKLKTKTELK